MARAPVATLGMLDAALIVAGSIVGAGVFVVGGTVARSVQSPAGFLAVWVVGGVIALAGALSNGELGARIPRGGGEYVYLREAYGPAVGFLSGWASFWVGFPGSIAALAAAFGRTVVGDRASSWAALIVAMAVVVALTVIDALGLRPSKWTQNALSGAKLLAFASLLAAGALVRRAGPSHFEPFFAREEPSSLAFALVPVFFAYTGWNAATYVAGEIRDAPRNLGRALTLGTAASVALYLAVNATYLRALSLDELRSASDPARAALERLASPRLALLETPLVALSILGSLQATILTGPRIYQAMAADGLFFPRLARLHPRTGVPLTALLVQALVACALLVSGTFEQLLTFATFAILAFSTLTVIAVFVLRVRHSAPPAFRVPLYPLVPAAFVVACAWITEQVLASGAIEALVGCAIVGLGLPAYAWFRRGARLRATSAPSGRIAPGRGSRP